MAYKRVIRKTGEERHSKHMNLLGWIWKIITIYDDMFVRQVKETWKSNFFLWKLKIYDKSNEVKDENNLS